MIGILKFILSTIFSIVIAIIVGIGLIYLISIPYERTMERRKRKREANKAEGKCAAGVLTNFRLRGNLRNSSNDVTLEISFCTENNEEAVVSYKDSFDFSELSSLKKGMPLQVYYDPTFPGDSEKIYVEYDFREND